MTHYNYRIFKAYSLHVISALMVICAPYLILLLSYPVSLKQAGFAIIMLILCVTAIGIIVDNFMTKAVTRLLKKKTQTKPPANTVVNLSIFPDIENQLIESNKQINAMQAGIAKSYYSSQKITATIDEIITDVTKCITSAREQIIYLINGSGHLESNSKITGGEISKLYDNNNSIVAANIEVSKAVEEAQDAAERGMQSADTANTDMQMITQAILNFSHQVNSLKQKSTEIFTILTTINGVTKQTNMLALNAAIEASRAGEHGKGFSIVADKIRALSDMSSESTTQIANIINVISSDIDLLAREMSSNLKRIDKGQSTIKDSSRLMDIVVTRIARVNQEVIHINTLTESQNQNMAMLNMAINDFTSVTSMMANYTKNSLTGINHSHTQLNSFSTIIDEINRISSDLKQTVT